MKRFCVAANTLVASGLLISSTVLAETTVPIVLEFDSLPSAQGFTYESFNNSNPETTVFSVDGTTLFQDSLASPFQGQGSNSYFLNNALDPAALSFTLEVRARLIEDENAAGDHNHFGFAFAVAGSNGFGVAEHGALEVPRNDLPPEGPDDAVLLDTSVFHDYRYEGDLTTGRYELFVDNILRTAGLLSLNPPFRLILGDSTGGANARGEVTLFVFTQRFPTLPLEHFVLYDVKITKGGLKFEERVVSLEDQFEAGMFTVKKVEEFGNPADKNGEGIVNRETHYVSYKIKRGKEEPKHVKLTGILVTNQFGEITLDTKKSDRLLVPSAKDLDDSVAALATGADHFKCYKVKVTKDTPKFVKRDVSVVDQFEQPTLLKVEKPERLCTPVSKDGSEIGKFANHLLCYKVKRARGEPKFEKVEDIHTNNQFGPLRFDARREEVFCLPSEKDLSAAVPLVDGDDDDDDDDDDD